MNYKPISIGVEDFKDIIRRGYYYVDKTLLIDDLLRNDYKVTLFTRPRRFGKTLNLSMLKYFFEDTGNEEYNKENRRLFNGLKIMNVDEASDYLQYMQSYPVISLTLKSAKQATYEDALGRIREEINREFERHKNVVLQVLENKGNINKFHMICEDQAEDSEYLTAIAFLSECMYKAYGKKVIILIDEYDVPLENAYYRGFYDEMVMFIRSLFESALKTNPNLEFAVITGCLRISKESIFTGLNNFKVISVLEKKYSEHFGFTPNEVADMAEYYGVSDRMDYIRKWYDGYLFGNSEVYNPWSVINYIDALTADRNALPRPYWSNTSSNSIVKDLIDHADDETKNELEILTSGGTIEKPVYEDITYDSIYDTQDNLWNFLFFTGYLKKISERLDNNQIFITLTVPNCEILYIYETHIKKWFDKRIKSEDLSALYTALLQGDEQGLQNELTRLLMNSISYMDSAEAFYHGFLQGVLQNLGNGYLKKSNRESGKGRFDICVYNKDFTKPAAVIELKTAKNARQMEQAAEKALAQIKDMRYDSWLYDEGYDECWHIGIGFFRKNCRIKIEKHEIVQPQD